MKTNITNAVVIITLHLSVLACSKMESNDMMFKSAVTSDELASPVPGDSADPTQDSSIVVVENPEPVPSTPVVSTPVLTPVETTPVVTTPVETTPVVTTPVETTPVVTTPVETTPVVTTPVETTPVVTTPVETTPVVTTPVETTPVVVVTDPDIMYPEDQIPVCKIDVVIGGLGSAASLSVASAPKDLLKNSVLKGFESLSASELAAMRSAVDSLSSADGVQAIKGSQSFNKSLFKNGSKILVVIDGSEAHSVDMNGLGKDSQIYIMAIAKDHNTVCVRNNGNSNMGEFAMTVQGDPNFVSRASADLNGTGSLHSFIKVAGGNQTGSNLKFNSMKDLELDLITEGKNDTFSSIDANSITGGKYNIQVKGKDHTGFGVNTKSISDGEWNMQIEGEDEVSLLMSDVKLSNNDVHGWIKSKSGASLDQSLAGIIELMTIP